MNQDSESMDTTYGRDASADEALDALTRLEHAAGGADGEPAAELIVISAQEAKAFKPQRVYKVIPAPELGAGRGIRLQSLNSSEVSAYEASNIDGMGADTTINLENSDARLLAWAWVDGDGVRIFNPREADQVRQVGRNDAGLVKRAVEWIQTASGMKREDKKSGKAPPATD
jgi:hypothetical protein